MSKLEVTIPAVGKRSYNIHIGSGTISGLWRQLDEQYPHLQKFVVTDANLVAAGHLEKLLGKNNVPTYVIDPAGEVSKTINTVVLIVEAMEKAMLGRDSIIVALGGGTVGDIAGFAAAIFKRGIKVVHVPTTTVAQADSSVGGKTGVDSTVSKNAFGAFWHPEGVYIDTETLKSLDDRQYRAGLAESVKHALIADSAYFDYLDENMPAILERDQKVLQEIAYKNCSIKAGVVAEDPTEMNKRRILNFGHTIGHAVESVSNFELLHGEAVAIGIIGAELIAQKLGFGAENRLDRIRTVLTKLGMGLEIPSGLAKKDLINTMKCDKKAIGQWPKFVLLEDVGTVHCRDGQWACDVSREIVEETLDALY
ncbi:MAG: 3-dehydroquinate synthase [Planctomycetota bacterium]|jgi:3-dehydroquinate synthase